jgi:putative transcriptional regulator
MIQNRNWAYLVRTARNRLGLTQKQFSSRLGVTFATVNRWENGRVTPSSLALRQLADLLSKMGSDGDDLMGRFFAKSETADGSERDLL